MADSMLAPSSSVGIEDVSKNTYPPAGQTRAPGNIRTADVTRWKDRMFPKASLYCRKAGEVGRVQRLIQTKPIHMLPNPLVFTYRPRRCRRPLAVLPPSWLPCRWSCATSAPTCWGWSSHTACPGRRCRNYSPGSLRRRPTVSQSHPHKVSSSGSVEPPECLNLLFTCVSGCIMHLYEYSL